jgi:hypothetical protein
MNIPFTTEQFLDLFQRYNTAVWPAQLIGYIIVLISLFAVIKRYNWGNRMMVITLGLLWLWTGVVYHFIFFSRINPVAVVFSGFFVLNGLTYVIAGNVKGKLSFKIDGQWIRIVGYIFMAYAMVVYFLLGMSSGHTYPRMPVFPLAPCPLTIFTFGVLLTAEKKVPWYIWIIPFVWSIIGFTAALRFGIKQDFGLLVAGIAGLILMLIAGRRQGSEAQMKFPTSK